MSWKGLRRAYVGENGPTSSSAVLEANVSFRCGRNNSSTQGGFKSPSSKFKNHQKLSAPTRIHPTVRPNDMFHRCRSGHWPSTCCAPKEVVEQYKTYMSKDQPLWFVKHLPHPFVASIHQCYFPEKIHSMEIRASKSRSPFLNSRSNGNTIIYQKQTQLG